MEGLILICILLCLAWQDIKKRTISIFILIALGLFSISFILIQKVNIENIIINLTITILILGFLSMYYKVKLGIKTRIINRFLGLGDILLLLLLTPFFSPVNFIIYINSACILALVFELFINKENNTIPLVSYLTLSYLLLMTFQSIVFSPTYYFNKDWIWF